MQVQVLSSAPIKDGVLKKEITFGTSGHRGIINTGFTIKHVIAIAHAITSLLTKESNSPTLVIGYDPRQGNSPSLEDNSFTKALADTLLSRGVNVHFLEVFSPTPLVSWYIVKHQIDGGIILTASHNPPEYNGIKFNPKNGAPAPPEITQEIERLANHYHENKPQFPIERPGTLKKVNATQDFSKDLVSTVETMLDSQKISCHDMALAIDTKHGATAQVWQALSRQLGLHSLDIIHENPTSDFGGIEPNPTKLSTLDLLKESQNKHAAPMAVSNDPDGDRFVMLDEKGTALLPEEVTVIILDYLIQKNRPVWGIATTVASSRLCKVAAEKNTLNFAETAVGFKYFAAPFETALVENKLCLGVESSGGFSTSAHTFEKCGFLPAIMMLYILNDTSLSISQLRENIYTKYGTTHFLETEFHYNDEKKEKIQRFLKDCHTNDLSTFFSQTITELIKVDGLKIMFDTGDWVLFRLSGTEPLARIYGESSDSNDAKELLKNASSILDSL